MNFKTASFALCLLGWELLVPESAYAYIDPGIGSLLWQLVLAGFFGGAFFIHKVRQWIGKNWNALRSFFSSRSR